MLGTGHPLMRFARGEGALASKLRTTALTSIYGWRVHHRQAICWARRQGAPHRSAAILAADWLAGRMPALRIIGVSAHRVAY